MNNIKLEQIAPLLQSVGVAVEIRTKHFRNPLLDYPYILCRKDDTYFEVRVTDFGIIFDMGWYVGEQIYRVSKCMSTDELFWGGCYLNYFVNYFISQKKPTT